MIRQAGAGPGDLDELSTDIGRMGGLIAFVLFTEQEDGLIRVNLRSKHTIDMSRIAREFGGGGHARASGARIAGPLAQVKQRVVQRLLAEEALR